jgi:hypothetical protein
VAVPAVASRDDLHDAFIGEDAEDDHHLLAPLVRGVRLDEALFRGDVGESGVTDGVVALGGEVPGDRLPLEPGIAHDSVDRIVGIISGDDASSLSLAFSGWRGCANGTGDRGSGGC